MAKGKTPTTAQIAEMQRRVARGDDRTDIAADMSMAPSTVYKYAPVRKGGTTITLPGLTAVAPADGGNGRAVMVSREQLQRMGGDTAVVAAEMRTDSLKMRILRAVAETGPFSDVLVLCKAVRRGPADNFGPHEVVSLLHALSKQGAVTFNVSKRAPGVGDMLLSNIRAADRAYDLLGIPERPPFQPRTKQGARPPGYSRRFHAIGVDPTESSNHPSHATGGDISRSTRLAELDLSPRPFEVERVARPQTVQEAPATPAQPPAPAVAAAAGEPRRWPELERIKVKVTAIVEWGARADAYLQAAVALGDVDPEAAAELLNKAERGGPEPLTALEREYLEFAGK